MHIFGNNEFFDYRLLTENQAQRFQIFNRSNFRRIIGKLSNNCHDILTTILFKTENP